MALTGQMDRGALAEWLRRCVQVFQKFAVVQTARVQIPQASVFHSISLSFFRSCLQLSQSFYKEDKLTRENGRLEYDIIATYMRRAWG